MALLFENEEAGRKIFERWRERFGDEDKSEEIYLSVVRRLPNQNKHHYCFLITSGLPETGSAKPNQMFAMASRYMVMEPDSSDNLEQFLTSYQRFGAYFLLPAFEVTTELRGTMRRSQRANNALTPYRSRSIRQWPGSNATRTRSTAS